MKTKPSSDMQTLHQCTVVSIDDSIMAVKAFYNPSKIKINKEAPWTGHSTAHGHAQVLEFTGAKNQTLSVDLFFDGYEAREDVSTYISTLVEMTEATIRVSAEEKALRSQVNNNSKDSKAHRPHFVMLVWGDMPAFKGVITSLDTEYSMFLPSGTPVRATCSLKMTELHIAQMVNVNFDDALRYRNELVRNRSV